MGTNANFIVPFSTFPICPELKYGGSVIGGECALYGSLFHGIVECYCIGGECYSASQHREERRGDEARPSGHHHPVSPLGGTGNAIPGKEMWDKMLDSRKPGLKVISQNDSGGH